MSLPELQRRLGYTFEDANRLERALTHSSYANENRVGDNERLEFLGDAVLELVVSALLVERFPAAKEGQLSRLRSRLVNTHALAELAGTLQIGSELRLGVGEESTGGRSRVSVLADAFEAVVGAVFEDGGYPAARTLAEPWLQQRMAELDDREVDLRWKDSRSRLQEVIQRDRQHTPTYRVTNKQGPAHAPVFTVDAVVLGEVLGTGTGGSKREAARNAADAALSDLGDPPEQGAACGPATPPSASPLQSADSGQ